MQLEVENIELTAHTSDGARIVIPIFRIDLDPEEIRFLNPSEAS